MTKPRARTHFAPILAVILAIGTACSTSGDAHESESSPRMGVHYVEIVSNDVDALTETYKRMLGVSFGSPDPDLGQARVATLADGSLLGIRKPLAEHEQPIMRTYLAVGDIERAVKQAEEHGAVVAYPPTRQGQRGMFAIVFQGDVQHGLWQR